MTKYKYYEPLIKSLNELVKLMDGHKLIIIGDVPGASELNVMECLTKLKWFNSRKCLAVQKEGLNVAAINVNKVLEKYASKHKNVYFINPYNTFCKNNYCKNLDKKGDPLYADGRHLSKVGSIYFINSTKSQIVNILSK